MYPDKNFHKVSVTLALLACLSVPNVFAQESAMTLYTNVDMVTEDIAVIVDGQLASGEQGKLVGIEIRDSQGKTILVRTLQTDRSGSFSFQFKFPPNAAAGEYTIVANVNEGGTLISQTKQLTYGQASTESKPLHQLINEEIRKEELQVSEPQQVSQEQKTVESEKGGCLIATAAYGTELAPQVQMLRELRDGVVFSTGSGTAFMATFNQFYYSFSPTVADWERQNPAFKQVVRTTLAPMLSTLSILNYVNADSEPEMLGYGIGIILLNIGMYFVAPAVAIAKLGCRFKNL